ncbi:hypothetical protein [Amycolatopsis saalfeldensis]|uniref:Uncharacterized protein n=1 Tax=Amycolatopsis saalfeldensis TaxID=394193 RepID=A0A1H8YQB6_9PSEU|nr:hypothetical protein [Amycolatopsis saalfeldensis]SEP54283.1 hypothetical protein SAMN04489732_1427 [Amycolatopsis saalfeldensis]
MLRDKGNGMENSGNSTPGQQNIVSAIGPGELFAAMSAAVRGDDEGSAPAWSDCAVAGLMIAQAHGRFGDIERGLMAALLSRIRWHAGKLGTDSAFPDEHREGAYIKVRDVFAAMALENPPLTGTVYINAVTAGPAVPSPV